MVRCPCTCNGYRAPAVAVDAIVENGDEILLIKRKKEPFKGAYALPGGFVECGESCGNAVVREVEEETGLKVRIKELFGVYSEPSRDPRGHVISICYIVEVVGGSLKAGSDASDACFFNINDVKKIELAFDHSKIIEDYIRRCRRR